MSRPNLITGISRQTLAHKSNPTFTFFLGDALGDAGRNDEAAEICGRLPPEYPLKSQCIPGTLVRQGKASEVIQTYVARPGNSAVNAALACAYLRVGRRDDAEKTADLSGFYRTVAFACLGDKDRVFDTFESNAALGPIRIG